MGQIKYTSLSDAVRGPEWKQSEEERSTTENETSSRSPMVLCSSYTEAVVRNFGEMAAAPTTNSWVEGVHLYCYTASGSNTGTGLQPKSLNITDQF